MDGLADSADSSPADPLPADPLPAGPLPAGPFGSWLEVMGRAIDDGSATDVACGTCTACCASSQFVHIGPDETAALRRIPAALRFPAPGLPAGHVVLGYDEHGRCPMLGDHGCSIYADRPRTCRTYDCRVFAAAGVEPDTDQPAIADRTRRWRFDHPTAADQSAHDAVRAAARFVAAHGAEVTGARHPVTALRHAVLAVEVHGAFLATDETGGSTVVDDPSIDAVRLVLTRRRPARR